MQGMKLARSLLPISALTMVTVLCAGGAPGRARRQGPALDDLAWMAGHWASEHDGARTEELWLAPAGGLMLAVNRTTPKSGGAAFEFLRIEQRKSELVYVASPSGRSATEFPLADVGEGFVQFENPEHDFPKVIRYELGKDGALHARVSDGHEQAMEWTWKKQ
jgi:hypothetical protein